MFFILPSLGICCVDIFQNNDNDRTLEKRLRVIHDIIGSGLNRKIILGNGKGEIRPWYKVFYYIQFLFNLALKQVEYLSCSS